MTCQALSPLDPAIDLDHRVEPALVAQSPQRADLRQHRRQMNFCPPKPGIDRHDQDDIAEIEHLFDLRQRRRRVEHDPGRLAEVADVRQRAVQMDRRARLAMHQQMIGAGLGEMRRGSAPARPSSDARRAASCVALRTASTTTGPIVRFGHEAPVHHIDMDPVAAGLVDRAHLVGEPRRNRPTGSTGRR